MKEKKVVLLIGGDLRQVHLADLLSEQMQVYVLALNTETPFRQTVNIVSKLERIPVHLDYLILPMPALQDEVAVSTPLSDMRILIAEVLDRISHDVIVLGGQIKSGLKQMLEDRQITYYDYLQREELAVQNAVATSEGALQIMMEELPVTIYGLSCLIIGSGRISRVLRKSLVALGAKVAVSARKYAELSWAEIDGCTSVQSKLIEDVIGDYDLIVNTVPAMLLTEKILRKVKSSSLVIDLASKPGGVDFDVANKLGIKAIWALSLPGKVAPITSGEMHGMGTLFSAADGKNKNKGYRPKSVRIPAIYHHIHWPLMDSKWNMSHTELMKATI